MRSLFARKNYKAWTHFLFVAASNQKYQFVCYFRITSQSWGAEESLNFDQKCSKKIAHDQGTLLPELERSRQDSKRSGKETNS